MFSLRLGLGWEVLSEKLKGCSRHILWLKKVNVWVSLNSWKKKKKNQATPVLRDHYTVIRDFVNTPLANKYREVTAWSCNNWYEVI